MYRYPRFQNLITPKSKKVICLESGRIYYFGTENGKEAIEKMLYTLNLSNEDKNAKIKEHERTFELVHNGYTYCCLK